MYDAADAEAALARVRELCLALPEVTERVSHGSPSWFVREKTTIATFNDDLHGDGRLAVWVAAAPDEQEALVAEHPVRFFRPPYRGVSGWVGLTLHPAPDWSRVEEMIEDSFRLVAPKRLVASWDAGAD